MIPTLSSAASEALDQALDQFRLHLLATAATRQQAANHQPAARCHSTGASSRTPQPRGTGTAA